MKMSLTHSSSLMFLPFVGLFCSLMACTEKDKVSTPNVKPVEDKNYQFSSEPVWADEFDVPGKPSSSKWFFETGASGWGNNELQYYTKGDNANIADGILTIEARKESVGGASYTSTRMITRGLADWLYGRFEARIKLPAGVGTWPAFWMLPTDNAYGTWPKSGEIDIMEHVGKDPNKVHITVHTDAYNGLNGLQKGNSKMVPTAIEGFHNYRVDWTPYAIRGYIDDEKVFEYVNTNSGYAKWPFNKRFFLLLNIAVGGNWGGPVVNDAAFPARMEVDYVRVYSLVNP